jgi:MFS family permease
MRGLGRDFRFLMIARGVSVIGDEAALIALIFRVKSHGSWATAALLGGTSIAMILTSAWVGKLVDRASAKKVFVITSFLQAVVCFGLIHANMQLTIILNIFLGVGQAIALAASGAWVPALVPNEKLDIAYGHVQSVASIAALAGYGIGGLLVGRAGIGAALVLDAITFLLLVPMLLAMKQDRIGKPVLDQDGKMKGGFKIIWHNSALRAIAFSLTAFVTALMIFNPLEIYLTTDILGAGPTGYGIINMVWAASVGIGSILITKLMKTSWGSAKPAFLAFFTSGFLMIGIGYAPNLVFLGFVLAITGIIVAGFNIFIGPLIARNSIESERGRVNATIGALTSAGSAVGMALGGFLGHVLPIRFVIAMSGVLASSTLIFTGKGLLASEKKKGSE